jgi:hypothetical protein
MPKTDHLDDEEARMAEAGEGGDDAAMIQHTTAGEFFRHFERAAKVNLQRGAASEESSVRIVSREGEESERVKTRRFKFSICPLDWWAKGATKCSCTLAASINLRIIAEAKLLALSQRTL